MKTTDKQIIKLMNATGFPYLDCMDALASYDSIEDATEALLNKVKINSNIKKGMIVTVTSPVYLPSSLNSLTTKVLRVVKDNTKESWEVESGIIPMKISTRYGSIVLLENNDKELQRMLNLKYLNKPCLFESLNSIRPATEQEKKLFRNQITGE